MSLRPPHRGELPRVEQRLAVAPSTGCHSEPSKAREEAPLRQVHVGPLAVLLFVTGACSAAETNPPLTSSTTTTASASPTSAPRAPSTPAVAGALVAVTRGSGALELYEVDLSTRAAKLLRPLRPPTDAADVVDVTVASGAAPRTCASWNTGPTDPYDVLQSTVICYAWGSEGGQVIAGAEQATEVALSADAGRLAWSQAAPGETNPIFSTAALDDDSVNDVSRHVGVADQPEDAGVAVSISDLAWAGDQSVIVSLAAQSDDATEPHLVDLSAVPPAGWLRGKTLSPAEPDDRYTIIDGVQSATESTALAVQRNRDDGGPPGPSRAIRLDMDGRIVNVIATAAEGRQLDSVSGGDKATLYATSAEDGTRVRVHLRLPGEERGTRITGLPRDIRRALLPG